MAQTINTNLSSMTAQRNQAKTQGELATAINRLSSGLRINSAKDDAAGMAISERMTSQIRGLNQAARNANDGISLAQVAEGALGSIGTNLQRMRELAVQSANATNSTSDRAALQQEVAQLAAEIDRVATQTQFNGLPLLDGSYLDQQYQVGANANQTITVTGIPSVRASALGLSYGVSVTASSLGSTGAPAGIAALNDMVINGVDVYGASGASATIPGDASKLAGAINSANITGVTATASSNVETGAYTASGTYAAGSGTLTINNIAVPVTTTSSPTANQANVIAAINSVSAATGVTASQGVNGVTLTAADGRNITTTWADGASGAATLGDLGVVSAANAANLTNTQYGSYTIKYTGTNPLTITGNATANDVGVANTPAGGIASSPTGVAISAVDISDVDGANAALSAIDAALTTVNSNRAVLGAIQNRFQSTIENLQTASENLSASRSRIQDADFAAETAALARAQILQQAGTAMIAQANQLPQQVLSLLK